MSVATARCVMVMTPHGKRLRLMALPELLQLEKKGKARKLSPTLWEVLETVEPVATPQPQPVQQPQPRQHGNGRHNKRSKTK